MRTGCALLCFHRQLATRIASLSSGTSAASAGSAGAYEWKAPAHSYAGRSRGVRAAGKPSFERKMRVRGNGREGTQARRYAVVNGREKAVSDVSRAIEASPVSKPMLLEQAA